MDSHTIAALHLRPGEIVGAEWNVGNLFSFLCLLPLGSRYKGGNEFKVW